MIPSILAWLEQVHQQRGLGWRELCAEIPYATLMRWRARLQAGQPLLRRPGPKKTVPLGPAFLAALGQLKHGPVRSRGTTQLHRQFSGAISRRQVQALARQIRREKRNSMKHILWLRTNLAWSIDSTDYQGWKIIPLHDLASRYRLDPLISRREDGRQIALFLDASFRQHGAPLLLKRDNGSAFNNQYVDQVLARYWVLPLNSPPRYPRYNGAIEKAIRELKEALEDRWPYGRPAPTKVTDQVDSTVHRLNHRPRRCLGGLTPCRVFHDPVRALRLPQKARQKIFRLLHHEFLQTIKSMNLRTHHHLAAAWRLTVERWLRCQNLIAINQNKNQKPNGKVSTIFQQFWSHN